MEVIAKLCSNITKVNSNNVNIHITTYSCGVDLNNRNSSNNSDMREAS